MHTAAVNMLESNEDGFHMRGFIQNLVEYALKFTEKHNQFSKSKAGGIPTGLRSIKKARFRNNEIGPCLLTVAERSGFEPEVGR